MLHVEDSDYAPIHFSMREKRHKDLAHKYIMGLPESGIFTPDHDLHRLRRNALNSMFSKRSITAYEPMVQGFVEKMCSRIESYRGNGQVLNVRLLFTCFTTDVVSEYSIGRCTNLMSTEDLGFKWRSLLDTWMMHCHWFKHFPIIWKSLNATPPSIITWLAPDMELVVDLQNKNRAQIKDVIRTEFKGATHPTVFAEVLHSRLPAAEKDPERLFQEGQSVLGAGSETVSSTLGHLMFYILDNPEIHQRLREEILPIMPQRDSRPTWQQLEQLPYLSTVIQEGLRFSPGISVPVGRVAPHQTIQFKGWTIPAGTTVGMSLMALNFDPQRFPDPHKFVPERWMNKEGQHPPPEHFAFSKGTRICVGIKYGAFTLPLRFLFPIITSPTPILLLLSLSAYASTQGSEISCELTLKIVDGCSLGYCELYLALAALIRRFEFELYDTRADEVVHPFYDAFVPMPREYAKGVRVRVS